MGKGTEGIFFALNGKHRGDPSRLQPVPYFTERIPSSVFSLNATSSFDNKKLCPRLKQFAV
jgi:hypothetical protein